MKKFAIKKIPIEIIIFILITICIERLMYLVDNNTFRILGLFNIDDFSLLLYVFLFIIVFIKYFRFPKTRYCHKFLVIFPLVLAFTSSYMGMKVYDQPFMLGFRPQRFFILTYLLYFPIKRMISCNLKNKFYIKKVLIGIGTIELFLFIMQYFLIDKVIYLYVRVSSRFGDVRLPIESFLLLLLPFVLINEIFNKKNTMRNYFLLGLNLFYIVVVVKTRMIMIGMLVTLSILLFIYKKGADKIVVVLILILCGIVGVNSSIGKGYLQSLSREYISQDNNSLVRKNAQKFYINETSKTPLLGRGFVNTKWNNATYLSMYDNGYYFNDNGIIGFYYLYGIIGLIWVMFALITVIRDGYLEFKKSKNYYFIGYSINAIIICITFFTWYFQQGALYLLLTLVILETEIEFKYIKEY